VGDSACVIVVIVAWVAIALMNIANAVHR